MNLTPEQIKQRRTEFEEWANDSYYMLEDCIGGYIHDSTQHAWESFQAAWRPVPSVEEIDKIIRKMVIDEDEVSIQDVAQAIHRAFGGQDE